MQSSQGGCQKKIDKKKKIDVAEMKVLRWMARVTKRVQIRNENIRETVIVAEVSKKIQESRMRCYKGLRRRDGEDHVERETMEVQENKRTRTI